MHEKTEREMWLEKLEEVKNLLEWFCRHDQYLRGEFGSGGYVRNLERSIIEYFYHSFRTLVGVIEFVEIKIGLYGEDLPLIERNKPLSKPKCLEKISTVVSQQTKNK